jgi:hypothetical protein
MSFFQRWRCKVARDYRIGSRNKAIALKLFKSPFLSFPVTALVCVWLGVCGCVGVGGVMDALAFFFIFIEILSKNVSFYAISYQPLKTYLQGQIEQTFLRLQLQGCQMIYFHTKSPVLVHFVTAL